MSRKRMSPGRDKKVFRRTAIGTKAINQVSKCQPRGGIRL